MEEIQRSAKMNKAISVRTIYRQIARDIALLKKEYDRLDPKEKFLRSEVLLHLAELSHEDDYQSSVVINKQQVFLHRDHLVTLQKHLDCMKKSSCIEITPVEQTLDVLENEEEDLTSNTKSLMESHLEKGRKDEEKGLTKSTQIQGKIGQFTVETKLVTQYLASSHSKQIEVSHLHVYPEPDCVKLMLNTFQPLEPSNLNHFLSSLHYFEMLTEEREETTSMLEGSVHVTTIKTSEPWVLEFHPNVDQLILLKWGIDFRKRGLQFEHKISISCSDEVIALYNREEEISKYLSNEKELTKLSDIVSFFEAFPKMFLKD